MNTAKIPKIMIQFWHDKNTLPDVYKAAMAKNKSHNSEFDMLYIDDCFMRNLLKTKFSQCLLDLYQANKIPASRSDIARLALLYEYGGFYMDLAIVLNDSLNCFIDANSELILLKRDDMPKYSDCPDKAHVWNGMLAAAPKSAFINACLQRIINNLLSGHYNNDVLEATGPKVLNKVLAQYNDNNIKTLSFKQLKQGFLQHLKVAGVRQSWVALQTQGIIDSSQLALLNKNYTVLSENDSVIN
jgi:mannosyltransferase OCH1-like enzyme